MASRLKNGRFVKKKVVDKVNKAVSSMAKQKKLKVIVDANEVEFDIPDEYTIVSLKTLAKNLKCAHCRSLLDMEKLTDFNRKGLHVTFTIKCDNCARSNIVNTGTTENKVSDINSSIVLGAIHAGVGATGLNKILACANLPRLTDHLYKKYENIVGQAIESEARNSCKQAALEEKELVMKNVQKLCDTL